MFTLKKKPTKRSASARGSSSRSKKSTKPGKGIISRLNLSRKETQLLLFVAIFAVLGGSVYAFHSFALTVNCRGQSWRRGNSGVCVTYLQKALIGYGYGVGSTGADGQFGPATEAAVKSFQSSPSRGGYSAGPPVHYALTPDGVVGPDTIAHLCFNGPNYFSFSVEFCKGAPLAGDCGTNPYTVGGAWSEIPNGQPLDIALHQGQTLKSPNGKYVMIFQGDGNVVVYNSCGKATWATNSRGNSFNLQKDSNLVLYNNGKAVWATNTSGQGSNPALRMQDDGNLVLYTSKGAVWALSAGNLVGGKDWSNRGNGGSTSTGSGAGSGTGSSTCKGPSHAASGAASGASSPQTLTKGAKLVSGNKAYTMEFQTGNGTVVVYNNCTGQAVWTMPGSGDQLKVQSDGNLVLYKGSTVAWASSTKVNGTDRKVLVMQDNGNLLLQRSGGSLLWSSLSGRTSIVACQDYINAGAGVTQGECKTNFTQSTLEVTKTIDINNKIASCARTFAGSIGVQRWYNQNFGWEPDNPVTRGAGQEQCYGDSSKLRISSINSTDVFAVYARKQ